MRIAYFDCFSGISGDMVLGAFLDAGLDLKTLDAGLKKLNLKGYKLKKERVSRGAIVGTKFDCLQAHGAGHSHRSLTDILRLIEKSSLNDKVKVMARDIFLAIGKAEAKIHGFGSLKDVHLHELGDLDSIIDIAGAAIAIDSLGIDKVYSSIITMGRAEVNTKAGMLPVPSPAALEILKGVPVRMSPVEAELVTPTGAGILKALSSGFGRMPEIEISGIGYGAGSKEFDGMPNMLRVMIGEKAGSFKEDRIVVIDTNIDDMSPQGFEYLFEKLFDAGALDVYTTVIQMKKTRPAFKLTVLVEPSDLKKVSTEIFRQTTTIGLRYHEASRFILDRRFVKADTKYGRVNVKISSGPGDIFTTSPEYDECAKLARKNKVPLKAVYDAARSAVKV